MQRQPHTVRNRTAHNASVIGVALLLLIAVTFGAIPAVCIALYYLWDGGPRPFRPWHVARGTRSGPGMIVFLAWIFGPIWMGGVSMPFVWVMEETSSEALELGALVAWWALVSIAIGAAAAGVYRSRAAGVHIGVATFAVPLAAGALAMRAWLVAPPWIGFVGAIALWNIWVVAVIVRTESPELRAQPGRCSRCGYDLRGAADPRCPECGATNTGRG
ncbi:MAG: hypothetical protein ACF8QF_12120 [Phycisphaerales bacterium]